MSRKQRENRKHGTRQSAASIRRLVVVCLLLTAYCLPLSVSAQYGRPPESALPQGGTPEVLKQVGIEQRLNEQVPLDITLRDETGRNVQLGEYFKAGKPVVLSLVYYECPMLCNQILNGQVGMMDVLSFNAGREFEAVTVSFDARETPAIAAAKKATYIKRYGRAGADAGWHFLTGDETNIKRLTEAVGFQYKWDEASQQFAHASALMVVTPQGRLSHYFYGIEYAPKEVRLALVEASSGKIGSPVDKLILYCYHYDPTTGKYGPVIMNFMRVAGVITVIALVALVLILRRRHDGEGGGGGGGVDGEKKWDESVRVGGTA
ncbi:MAG TPA: SCO family protein [Pyrinomonadaceae bacterium]